MTVLPRGALRLLLVIVLLTVSGPASARELTGPVDLNRASQQELEELPYIGASRARAIIAYRTKNGPFTRVDQLLEVSGIGRDSLDAIIPYLTIGSAVPAPPVAAAEFSRPITTRPGDIVMLADEQYFTTLVDLLRQAQHSIAMTMFLFKTTDSPKNRPALLVKELAKAREKGVRVHVLLERSGYDDSINRENERVARRLRKNGVTVSFDSAARTTHAKIVVIDRRYVLLGSHNLTHSALSSNHEMSLLIDSTRLAAELIRYMDEIR
ncbi:MAG: phospholipase D-like domain-containing protein [Thermodesulfobacteriota bacterium]